MVVDKKQGRSHETDVVVAVGRSLSIDSCWEGVRNHCTGGVDSC